MKNFIYLLIVSLVLSLSACNKARINTSNPLDLIVNTNRTELQKRIDYLNYPVSFNSLKTTSAIPSPPDMWAIAQIKPATRTVTEYTWTTSVTGMDPIIITQTDVAPQRANPATGIVVTYVFASKTDYADQEFSMTNVGIATINGKQYALFASHIRGDVYAGEIFVVEYDPVLDDDTSLRAEYSIFDLSADYNDLAIDYDAIAAGSAIPKLWITGDNRARGAVVRNISLHSLDTLSMDIDQAGLENVNIPPVIVPMREYGLPVIGPSGNSVNIFENQLWVVAGGTSYGGLIVMDKNDDSRLFTRADVANAKHFDMCEFENSSADSYYGAFLYGDGDFDNDNSNIRIFNTSGGPFNYISHTVSADVTLYGKNAIDVDDDDHADGGVGTAHIYLAMGADGVVKIGTDGAETHRFNSLNTFGGNGLANGLVVHGEYVYVAWGASGLVILNRADLTFAGQWNGIGSCNFIAIESSPTSDDIMWLGNGTGGMIMLKFAADI